MATKLVKRGDLYYANLNPVIGSEQGEIRPILVVQNDVGNKFSPTIVIVPITCSLKKKHLPTHVKIPTSCGLSTDSVALVEQIRTIDRSRFDGYIGHIGSEVQSKIDVALAICVSIARPCASKDESPVLCLCKYYESDFIDSNTLGQKGDFV